MRKPVQKDKMRLAGNTQAHRPETKADEVLVDPATNRPVARDLRFHRFVAHQRESYFLYQNSEQ